MSKFTQFLKNAVAKGIIKSGMAEIFTKQLEEESKGIFDKTPASVLHVDIGGQKRDVSKKSDAAALRIFSESIWVRAAIDVYRDSVGRAQWKFIPKDYNKPMKKSTLKEISQFLDNPNPSLDPYTSYREKMIEDYLVVGHGVLLKELNRDMTPRMIKNFDAAKFGFVSGWDGTDPQMPRYAILGKNGKIEKTLMNPQAMVLVNRSRTYSDIGKSHVEILDTTVRALLAGDLHHLTNLENPAAGGALNLGDGATADQVKKVRQMIEQVKKPIIVLGNAGDPKYIPFKFTERDMKFLDTQIWFVRQVAAIFKISTARLRLAVDTSRANTESMFEDDMEGVSSLLERFCQIEQRDIINSFDIYGDSNIQISYPILSIRGEKKQAEITSLLMAGRSSITVNESRMRNGYDKINEPLADEVLVETSFGPIPLSQVGKLADTQTRLSNNGENPNSGENNPDPKKKEKDKNTN